MQLFIWVNKDSGYIILGDWESETLVSKHSLLMLSSSTVLTK